MCALDLRAAPLDTAEVLQAADQPRRTSVIAGLGTALPTAVVDNAPIAQRIGVDDQWIVKRTGIRSRRRLADDDTLINLAARAATAAIAEAQLDADEIDMVLVATCTADDLLPNAAPVLAAEIGANRAGAMDVGAACTGFLSGLALASGLIESGRAQNVLLVGAEALSRHVNPDDKRTAAIFGDGAGAVVVAAGDGLGGGIAPVVLGADGDHGHLITLERATGLIEMNGHETFVQAVARLTEATPEAVARAGLTLDDIDLFVFHQANSRILRAVGERLQLPAHKVVDCIEHVGNTSAASLPLALGHARRQGQLHAGARVLLGAVGSGFTWGATVVDWSLA